MSDNSQIGKIKLEKVSVAPALTRQQSAAVAENNFFRLVRLGLE